jgi:ATP/maltotriose-dependent transcriptional regulator MalT
MSCQGDFEAYIRREATTSKMPVLEDFEKLLGKKTVLIIDDFHLIKQRGNARMRIFIDKVISRKVNLILVSVSELKLDFLPRMKKIKLDSLDNF